MPELAQGFVKWLKNSRNHLNMFSRPETEAALANLTEMAKITAEVTSEAPVYSTNPRPIERDTTRDTYDSDSVDRLNSIMINNDNKNGLSNSTKTDKRVGQKSNNDNIAKEVFINASEVSSTILTTLRIQVRYFA